MGTNGGMRWPDGSIPQAYTILVRARYLPGGAHNRIWTSPSFNWLCGWWNNQMGIAHFNYWVTQP